MSLAVVGGTTFLTIGVCALAFGGPMWRTVLRAVESRKGPQTLDQVSTMRKEYLATGGIMSLLGAVCLLLAALHVF